MPRSGTTLFCKFLARKFDLGNAGEIFHESDGRAKSTASKVINRANFNNRDFVCKYFPASDIFDLSKFNNRQNFYNVNLVRKDITKQFTSLYIAIETNNWQTIGSGEDKSSTVRNKLKINHKLLTTEFDKFIKTLYIKEQADKKIKYNEELYYEDIVDYLNENKQSDLVNIPSIKPINYNYIYIEVVNLFKRYVKNNDFVPTSVNAWYKNFQQSGFRQ